MSTAPTDLPGFLGFGAVARPLSLDPAGLLGWSVGRVANAWFRLIPPPGTREVRGPLTLLLQYTTVAGPQQQTLRYDPAYPLARQLPENIPITLSLDSAPYLSFSQEFTIESNTVQEIVVALAFARSYALVSRKQYLVRR